MPAVGMSADEIEVVPRTPNDSRPENYDEGRCSTSDCDDSVLTFAHELILGD
jgi:hypothetical protein